MSSPLPGPRTLESVLAEAAADPVFAEALVTRRLAAVEERGWELDAAGRALLGAAPEVQLRQAIAGLRQGRAPLPEDSKTVSLGIRPGIPPGPFTAPTAGIRPEAVRGTRPDAVRGTRPGCVIAGALLTTAVLGGAAATLLVSAGVRPDVPPISEPAPEPDDRPRGVIGVRPDAPPLRERAAPAETRGAGHAEGPDAGAEDGGTEP